MTTKQQKAMQRGREKRAKAARQEAIKRVRSYREWLRRDSEISVLLRRGESVKRERIPVIPSDHDFQIAREENVI